jgi:hypothetical protein
MKPELPLEVAERFPEELVRLIMSFVPHLPKPPTPTPSPSLERELRALQQAHLYSASPLYLRDLDEFVLEKPVRVKKRR